MNDPDVGKAAATIRRAYATTGRDAGRDLPIVLGMIALRFAAAQPTPLLRAGMVRGRDDMPPYQSALDKVMRSPRPAEALSAEFAALQDFDSGRYGAVRLLRIGNDAEWISDVARAIANLPTRGFDWGDLYEAVLEAFVRNDAVRTGEFFAPRAVCDLVAAVTDPGADDSIWDPACGSGSFLTAAVRRIESATSLRPRLVQATALNESTATVAGLNLALHSLATTVDHTYGTTMDDRFMASSADVIISNPPYNQSKWARDPKTRSRLPFGEPPEGNANFAWLQLALTKLRSGGRAALLMPENAARSSNPREVGIRRAMLEADVIAAVIALPPHLFPGTAVAPHLWLLSNDKETVWPQAQNQVLFIDGRSLGRRMSRSLQVLEHRDVEQLTKTFERWTHGWATDEPGLVRARSTADVISGDMCSLTPSHHVGVPYDLDAHHYDGVGPTEADMIESIRETISRLYNESREIDGYVEWLTSRVVQQRLPPGEAMPSLIGSVPRAWKQCTLGELIDLDKNVDTANERLGERIIGGPSGQAITSADYEAAANFAKRDQVPVVMPRDFSQNVLDGDRASRVSQDVARRLAKYALRPGDIVLARRGDVTRHALVGPEHQGWILGTGCIRVRFSDYVDPTFITTYLSHPAVAAWLEDHAQGTTVQSINLSTLRELPLVVPPLKTQQAIAETAVLLDQHARLGAKIREAEDELRNRLLLAVLTDGMEP